MTTSILLIEDDDDLRDVLVDVLEDKGYSVMGVASGDEAVRSHSHFDFDVVVSDVRMAGAHDGIGAVEVLKQRKPQLKCLIITGYADDKAPARALKIQVDDYLYKPFSLDEFMEAVHKIVRSATERNSLRQRLGRLLAAPFKAVTDKARQSAQEKLDEAVHQVWTALFVAIRSRLLTKGSFIDFWDKLENGYTRYQSLPESCSAAELSALSQGYQTLAQQLAQSAAMRAAGSHSPRTPQQFPKPKLLELYERVAGGKVSSEEFRLALAVARSPLGPESRELAEKLFGSTA